MDDERAEQKKVMDALAICSRSTLEAAHQAKRLRCRATAMIGCSHL